MLVNHIKGKTKRLLQSNRKEKKRIYSNATIHKKKELIEKQENHFKQQTIQFDICHVSDCAYAKGSRSSNAEIRLCR